MKPIIFTASSMAFITETDFVFVRIGDNKGYSVY